MQALDETQPPPAPESLSLPQDLIVPVSGDGKPDLPGSWNVEPSGAFTYRIPIEVPDGRAGMQPDLALVYSSASTRTGILGVGWHLEGLSSIKRCGKGIRQDGYADGVDHDAGEPSDQRDRLCLDGGELVMIAPGNDGYGSPGAEYRTELDRHARITTQGSVASGSGTVPERFVVALKSGRIREYVAVTGVPRLEGQQSQMADVEPDTAPFLTLSPVVDTWVLDKEYDRSGNTITYDWSMPSTDPAAVSGASGVEIRLDAIHYTSNPGEGLAAERTVELKYGTFYDDVSYRSGVLREQRSHLKQIVMSAPNASGFGETWQTQTEPVWQYEISYELGNSPFSHHKRIGDVRRCAVKPSGSGGLDEIGCTRRKRFDWNDADPVPTYTTVTRGTYTPSLAAFDPNDPSGWQASFDAAKQPPAAAVLDLDGDGGDDVVLQVPDGQTEALDTWMLRGTKSAAGDIDPLASSTVLANPTTDELIVAGARTLDLDGDGRDELIAKRKQELIDASGNSYDDPGTFAYRLSGSALVPDAIEQPGGYTVYGDVDGDGLPDALSGAGPHGTWQSFWETYTGGSTLVHPWVFWRNQGGTLVSQGPTDILSRCRASVADMDGDGKAEFEVAHDTIVNGLIEGYDPSSPGMAAAYDCSGRGRVREDEDGALTTSAQVLKPGPVAPLAAVMASLAHSQRLHERRGDFNGDGLADLITIRRDSSSLSNPPTAHVRFNSGNGYGPELAINNLFPAPIDGNWVLHELVGDFNGDGRADLLSLRRASYTFPDYVFPDLNQLMSDQVGSAVLALSKGDGTFDVEPLAGGAGLFEELRTISTTQAGDFNGDGATDLMRFVPTGDGLSWTLELLIQDRHYADRIASVTDEDAPWARESVTYDHRWTDRLESNVPCAYPLACSDGGSVVTRAVTSRAHLADSPTPDDDARTLHYSYEDAVSDRRGRGFLGFRKVRIWDPARPMEIVQEYDNRTLEAGKYFPYSPRPYRVTTVVPFTADGAAIVAPREGDTTGIMARVDRVETNYQVHPLHGGLTYNIDATDWTESTWEETVAIDWGKVDSPTNPTSQHIYAVNGATPLVVRTGSMEYDDFGNVEHAVVATTGGASVDIVTTFKNDTGAWLIGLPESVAVTATEADATQQTRSTAYGYDAAGRLETVEVEPGNPDASVRSTATLGYDGAGNLISRKVVAGDPASPDAVREMRIEYDPMFPGQPAERLYPSQVWSPFQPLEYRPSVWMAIHPAFGVVNAVMDANGVQSHATYDALGREVWSQAEGETAAQTSYAARPDAAGGVNGLIITSQVGPQTASVETDGLLRSLHETRKGFGGGLDRTDFAYDILGRLVQRSRPYPANGSPAAFESFAFDSLGRPTSSTAADGFTTVFDQEFFTTTATDPEGLISGVERDVDGRTVKSWNLGSQGQIDTLFAYAPFGLLRQVTDPNGHLTSYQHDALGRVVVETDPNAGTAELTYDGLDQLREVAHPASGSLQTRTYDDLGRLIQSVDADGTTTFEWDTAANGIGRLAHTASPDGVVADSEYDASGRLVARELTVNGRTYRIDLGFDSTTGHLTSIAYPSIDGSGAPGLTVNLNRNTADYVDNVAYQTPGQQAQSLWTVQSRKPDGALGSGVFGNGATATLSYDAAGRPEQIRVVSGAQTLFDLSYLYYRNGLVSSRTDAVAGRSERFTFDPLRRLQRWQLDVPGMVQVTDYGYDDGGNLLTVKRNGTLVEQNNFTSSAQPDTLIEHVENGVTESYSYDSRGRQLTGPNRTVVYNELDLPRSVTTATGTTLFAYDAAGNRVWKRDGDGQTVYVDGLYEHRMLNSGEAHVFHIPGTDGDVGQVVYAGGQYRVDYTAQDSLDSIGIVMNGAGQVNERMFFDPFGKRIDASGAPYTGGQSAVHEGFTGHEHDAELGLINMKGRIYDPRLKRFLSMDPIVGKPLFGQSWNPYSYVRNSPINLNDPTGFDPPDQWTEPKCEEYGTPCTGPKKEPPGPQPPTTRYELVDDRPVQKFGEDNGGASNDFGDNTPGGGAAGGRGKADFYRRYDTAGEGSPLGRILIDEVPQAPQVGTSGNVLADPTGPSAKEVRESGDWLTRVVLRILTLHTKTDLAKRRAQRREMVEHAKDLRDDAQANVNKIEGALPVAKRLRDEAKEKWRKSGARPGSKESVELMHAVDREEARVDAVLKEIRNAKDQLGDAEEHLKGVERMARDMEIWEDAGREVSDTYREMSKE